WTLSSACTETRRNGPATNGTAASSTEPRSTTFERPRSVGYWFGGRLADRDPTLRGLSKVVLLGSVLLAAVPFVAGPFLRVTVQALASVQAGAFVGSLVAVLVLLAVPVLVLGTVAPYAVRLCVRTVGEAGEVAGRLYAVSTIGSLTGVFLSALLLLPVVGTRRTFLAFALALAVVALPGLARVAVAVPAAIAVLIVIPVGTIKPAQGATVIWERETDYQYARAIQYPDGERILELNEGQAVHSTYTPGRWLTGNYWDEALVLPVATRPEPPASLAVLGNAAGTVARAYARYFPQTRVDGVEIDGELTEIGREKFGLAGPNLHLHTADARPFLRASGRRWDAILIDAYRQPYIPFYLVTGEFFELARDRLNPGGVVMVNVGHPEGNDDLEKTLSATMGTVFGTVLRDPSQQVNTVLLASEAPASGARLRGAVAAGAVPRPLRETALKAASRLAPALPGGEVYTDDRAPVEWLIDESILSVAAEGNR
ncbi:MAG: fused MFS/spermidine synthase, partial [Solirubrobacterales bacterium]